MTQTADQPAFTGSPTELVSSTLFLLKDSA